MQAPPAPPGRTRGPLDRFGERRSGRTYRRRGSSAAAPIDLLLALHVECAETLDVEGALRQVGSHAGNRVDSGLETGEPKFRVVAVAAQIRIHGTADQGRLRQPFRSCAA